MVEIYELSFFKLSISSQLSDYAYEFIRIFCVGFLHVYHKCSVGILLYL